MGRLDRRGSFAVWAVAAFAGALALPGSARADIVLQASADIARPYYNESFQAGSGGYAVVPFEATNTWVRATGGTPNTWASISWNMMIGWSDTVTVGVRHAEAFAEVWVPGTQNRQAASHVHVFSVVGQQGGGGGGDA